MSKKNDFAGSTLDTDSDVVQYKWIQLIKVGKNMKSSYYLLIGIYMLTLPTLTHAEAGWTDYVRIAELVPTSRHYYEVKLSVNKNPSGCNKNIWFYQDYELNGSGKMFETLLEGLKSRNQVRVYVTGKCNVNGYSEFTSVGIIP